MLLLVAVVVEAAVLLGPVTGVSPVSSVLEWPAKETLELIF